MTTASMPCCFITSRRRVRYSKFFFIIFGIGFAYINEAVKLQKNPLSPIPCRNFHVTRK